MRKVADDHPSKHPLWHNRRAEHAFKETLRQFWVTGGRMFEECLMSHYWQECLHEFLKRQQ